MGYIFKAIKSCSNIILSSTTTTASIKNSYFIIFFELNQYQIENFFWHSKICGSAIHDSFIIIIFLAVDSQAVSVYRNVSDNNLIIPLFHYGRVQHVPFVQILVQISKHLNAKQYNQSTSINPITSQDSWTQTKYLTANACSYTGRYMANKRIWM